MCEIGAAPIFTIRGLCDDTLFDRHYGWASEKSEISEKYKFQGFSSSAIFWALAIALAIKFLPFGFSFRTGCFDSRLRTAGTGVQI